MNMIATDTEETKQQLQVAVGQTGQHSVMDFRPDTHREVYKRAAGSWKDCQAGEDRKMIEAGAYRATPIAICGFGGRNRSISAWIEELMRFRATVYISIIRAYRISGLLTIGRFDHFDGASANFKF
jgi:hypothetical protein